MSKQAKVVWSVVGKKNCGEERVPFVRDERKDSRNYTGTGPPMKLKEKHQNSEPAKVRKFGGSQESIDDVRLTYS
jgi:hypothetical protein